LVFPSGLCNWMVAIFVPRTCTIRVWCPYRTERDAWHCQTHSTMVEMSDVCNLLHGTLHSTYNGSGIAGRCRSCQSYSQHHYADFQLDPNLASESIGLQKRMRRPAPRHKLDYLQYCQRIPSTCSSIDPTATMPSQAFSTTTSTLRCRRQSSSSYYSASQQHCTWCRCSDPGHGS
jgi:hypothetical protein